MHKSNVLTFSIHTSYLLKVACRNTHILMINVQCHSWSLLSNFSAMCVPPLALPPASLHLNFKYLDFYTFLRLQYWQYQAGQKKYFFPVEEQPNFCYKFLAKITFQCPQHNFIWHSKGQGQDAFSYDPSATFYHQSQFLFMEIASTFFLSCLILPVLYVGILSSKHLVQMKIYLYRFSLPSITTFDTLSLFCTRPDVFTVGCCNLFSCPSDLSPDYACWAGWQCERMCVGMGQTGAGMQANNGRLYKNQNILKHFFVQE